MEELNLRFGSLSTIAEEGLDVEVDGITLDILPSSNFEEELRQIVKTRIYRRQAEAAERKAAKYAAAAATAKRDAIRAAAAAEGFPMPESLRENVSSSATSSTNSSSFTSTFLSYFGLNGEEEVTPRSEEGADNKWADATAGAAATSRNGGAHR